MIFKTRIYKRIRVTRQLLKNSNVSFKLFSSLIVNEFTYEFSIWQRQTETKLKAIRVTWFLSELRSLISAGEIFKAPCQLHVASHRGCLFAMNSSRNKTEAGFEEGETEERSLEAARKGGGDRGGRVQWHSSGTRKRYGGISEIAPDIFACSVYIASRVAASCGSLLLPSPSLHSHPFPSCLLLQSSCDRNSRIYRHLKISP